MFSLDKRILINKISLNINHFQIELNYLDALDAKNFLKRGLFHPGSTKCEEQKREAREDYGQFDTMTMIQTIIAYLICRGTM